MEIHYGEIDPDLYHSLMKTLKRFIEDRFVGRTHKHSALLKWDYYVDQSLGRIRSCSSILFVLRHKSQPIAISLGHTIKNVLNSAITSYDKKFSRYSLGKIMFIKELEWCFLNGLRLLDTGWGNFEYKIKFSNAIYYYATHVMYPKKSFGKKVYAYFIGIFLEAKHYLIAIKNRRFKRSRDLYQGRWMQVERFRTREYRQTDGTT
nr:GNAT family N-acetyltransferase [Allomuricauda hymeniacidonis]